MYNIVELQFWIFKLLKEAGFPHEECKCSGKYVDNVLQISFAVAVHTCTRKGRGCGGTSVRIARKPMCSAEIAVSITTYKNW